MEHLDGGLSVDSAAGQILTALGADDDVDDAASEPKPELEGDEATVTDTQTPTPIPEGGDGTATADEAELPIEPPASWKADAKERFKALPRDLQATIADREREREQHFSRTQSETARARRAADAERNALQQERQATAQNLASLISLARDSDPILAEAARTDWARLSRENPAAAQAKWTAAQQRMAQLNALAAYRDQVQQQANAESARQADAKLTAELDVWRDPAQRKAFKAELQDFLVGNGFEDGEVASVTDPRAILLARKAMLYDRLMAQQAKIAAAKKPPQNGRILKSQASSDEDATPRADALLKRAAKTGRLDDQAAAIMARL